MDNNHIHVFKDTVVSPTCKENGYTLHKCDCGYEHRDNFTPLANHKFIVIEHNIPNCEQGGTRKLRCTVCGEEIIEKFPPIEHNWGEWRVQTFPTCTESGLQLRICGRCGCTEEQEIPPKGHKLVNPQKSKTEKKTIEYFCENCGQIIKQPDGAHKVSSFFSRCRKSVVFYIVSIVLVLCIALSAIYFINANSNYSKALDYIEEGKYAEAYTCLIKCGDYDEAKALLEDFDIYYGRVEYNGKESLYRYEYEYDDDQRLQFLACYDRTTNELKYRYEYEYKKGCLTTEIRYDEAGNLYKKFDYRYDSDGNLIFKTVTETVTDVYSSIIKEYEYDEKGNMLSETYYIYYNSSKDISHKIECEYDDDGNLIDIACYYDEDSVNDNVRYKFDKETKIITEFYYDSYHNLQTERQFKTNGDSVSYTSYDENGDIESKTKYNDKGHLIYYQNNNGDERIIYRGEYIYNEDGSYEERGKYEGSSFEEVTRYSEPLILYNPKIK